jgi:hypothetical protein
MNKILFLILALTMSAATRMSAQLPKISTKNAKEKLNEMKNKTNDPVTDDRAVTNNNGHVADTTDDEYIRLINHLKEDVSTVKTYVAKNELDFAEGSLRLARQRVNEIKKQYPSADLGKYETDLDNAEKVIGSKTQKAQSKDEAIAAIRKMVYGCNEVIPTTWSSRMYSQFHSDAERFYNDCIEADYTGSKKKIDGLLLQYPDLKTDNDIEDDIDDFYNKLIPKFKEFADFLIREGNGAIESAYTDIQNKNMVQATDNADIATMMAKSVLSFLPDDITGKKLLTEAEKVANKVETVMGGSVYSSAYHKANAGKFILSKNAIVPKLENASTSAGSFTLKDNIYGMVYLKGTVKDLSDGAAMGQTTMVITLFMDGNELGDYEFPMTEKMQQSTYVPIEILPSPETALDCAGAVKYATMLSQCSPREHEITFRFSTIYMSYRRDLATGTCQIDCSEGQEGLAAVIGAYRKRALKNVFMPKPAMNNPALEAEMIVAARAMLTNRDLPGTPVKAVITEDGWTIYRHPISGVITSRMINGAVSVKKPDGGCVFYSMTFEQEYAGGKYSKTQPHSVDSGTDIDCGNAGAK